MSRIIGDGITFDDVLLVPSYSEVIPNQVDITTNLTKSIKLNIPLMSAGMDTVTENRMAISYYYITDLQYCICFNNQFIPQNAFHKQGRGGQQYSRSDAKWAILLCHHLDEMSL